jgi:hypothetical protein
VALLLTLLTGKRFLVASGVMTVRAWKVAERASTSAQAQSSMLTIVSLQCRSTATQSLPKLLSHPARVIIIFIIVNVIFILLLSTSLSSLLVLANKTFFLFPCRAALGLPKFAAAEEL